MSGAIPLLLQYAFMAWCSVKSAGTALPFTVLLVKSRDSAVSIATRLRTGRLGV
jgi:hypothetical protein